MGILRITMRKTSSPSVSGAFTGFDSTEAAITGGKAAGERPGLVKTPPPIWRVTEPESGARATP
jgi:hypothetical protein